MNDRPIGVFDSGIGGLTVVRSLLRCLPRERIFYFGDTVRDLPDRFQAIGEDFLGRPLQNLEVVRLGR